MSLSVSSLATVTFFFFLVSVVPAPVARNLRRFLGGWKSVKNAVGQRCFAVLSQTNANNNKKARAQKIKTFFFFCPKFDCKHEQIAMCCQERDKQREGKRRRRNGN